MDWERGGTAWVLGHNVIGDDLIGGPEAVLADIYDPVRLAPLLAQSLDRLQAPAARGDFLVAGRNFGYCKAHQQVYLAFKGFGIGGVIAESFVPYMRRALPFYGIPYLRCPGITERVGPGDRLRIDFLAGTITNERTGESIQAEGVPSVVVPVYEAGSQLAYLKQKLAL